MMKLNMKSQISRWVLVVCLSLPLTAFSQSRVDAPLGNIELKDTDVGDAIRILAEMSGVNIVATNDARDRKVTLYLQNTTVKKALDSLSSITGLWYRYKPETGVYVVQTVAEYSRDVVVFRDEKMRTFTLRHHNVSGAADAITALFGSRVQITAPSNNGSYKLDGGGISGGRDTQNSRSNRAVNGRGSARTAGGGGTRRGVGGLDLPSVANLTPGQISAMEAGQRTLQKMDADKIGEFSQQAKATIYVTFNILHNLLFVRSSDEKALKTIAKLVKQIDKPASQVLLQMKIIQVNLGDNDRSVFDWGYGGGKQSNSTTFGANSNILGGTNAPRTQIGLGNFPAEAGTFALQLMNSRLMARIQMLKSQGRTETLSSPMLLASNNKAAEIFLGEERVLVRGVTANTTTSNGGTSTAQSVQTELKKIGNRLRIWPRINSDNTVTLDIDQEISSVLKGATVIPVGGRDFPIDSISESTLKLTVIGRNNMPVAIGGMISTSKNDNDEKVPFLGDIPGIGKLFRKTTKKNEKSELVLIITPRIMNSTHDIPKVRRQLAQQEFHQAQIQQHLTPQNIAKDKMMPADMKSKDYRLVKMVKQAAERLQVAIKQNKLESGASWRPTKYLQVNPVAAWYQNDLYVTAIRIRNLGGGATKLSPGSLLKGWKTVAYENDHLPVRGETYAYVVSKRSFSETVKSIKTR